MIFLGQWICPSFFIKSRIWVCSIFSTEFSNYGKTFSLAFKEVSRLSGNLAKEVDLQTRDIRSMLEGIRQGIFSIETLDGIVEGSGSKYLESILEINCEGKIN